MGLKSLKKSPFGAILVLTTPKHGLPIFFSLKKKRKKDELDFEANKPVFIQQVSMRI